MGFKVKVPRVSVKVPTIKQIASGIERDVKSLGTNVEANIRNDLQGIGMALGGNWNNIGSTALGITGSMLTGGLVNPNDVMKAFGTQTAMQRAQDEATQKAIDEANAKDAADLATQRNEARRLAESNIAGLIGARRMAPGRSLLRSSGGGSAGLSNTLLTLLGG